MPKAWLCREFGLPSKLTYEDILPPATCGDNKLILNVLTSGLDWTQNLMIQDKYQFKPKMPFTPGGEIVGSVLQVGKKVDGWNVGDICYSALNSGGFQEIVQVPIKSCLKMPRHLATKAVPSFYGYGTSLHALRDRANLQPGETLVVLGASGGVGITAVELGVKMGAKVIACCSTDEKLEVCKRYGATDFINYSKEDLKQALRTKYKRGVDVVYDPIGDKYADACIRNMAWNGRYLVIGYAAGDIPKIKTNLLLNKGSQAMGCALGFFQAKFPKKWLEMKDEIWQMFINNEINPLIHHQRYKLEEAPTAMQDMLDRKIIGKALISTNAMATMMEQEEQQQNQQKSKL